MADQYAGELGFKISYNDLLVRICARALDDYPNLQAQLDGERLVNPGSINIGLAIDAEDGLVVPNVKEVGKLQLAAIARSYRQLIDRSRTGSLQLDDLTGGTFTISNLGAMGVDTFTPVLNPPEAAILGVGGDEVVHSILEAMYADVPYTVLQRAVHNHPTVTELIPTMLEDLKPLE